jgi:hypothetical protein
MELSGKTHSLNPQLKWKNHKIIKNREKQKKNREKQKLRRKVTGFWNLNANPVNRS